MESELDMVITVNNAEATQRKRNPNRRFAELVGLCWHFIVAYGETYIECSCGKVFHNAPQLSFEQHRDKSNPDFVSDPRLVLREMMKREDFPEFMTTLYGRFMFPVGAVIHMTGDILDTTGLLVKAGIEWREKEEGK